MKIFENPFKKGFTLVELIISMGLLMILLTLVFSYSHMALYSWNKIERISSAQQNSRLAMHYIVREIRRHSEIKCIQAVGSGWSSFILVDQNNKYILDLRPPSISGSVKTELYFEKNVKQLRTNTNGEHNILVDYIEEIRLSKISDHIVEIEVIAEDETAKEKVALKTKLNINKLK